MKLIAPLLMLTLLLSSCGTASNEDISEEIRPAEKAAEPTSTADTTVNTETWTADIYDLSSFNSNLSYYNVTIWGNYIYYYASGEITEDSENEETNQAYTKYYRSKIGSDEAPEEIKLSGQGATATGFIRLQPDCDGNLYVIQGATKLAKYDEDGNELYVEKFPDEIRSLSPTSTAVDSEGNFYAATLEAIYLFNSDCTYKGMIDCTTDNCSSVFKAGDKVYFCSHTFDKISEISFNTVSVSKEIETNTSSNSISGYLDTGLISFFDGNIYYLDKETMKAQLLITLAECGVENFLPYRIYTLDDGRIVCISYDGNIVVLSKENNQKQIITIGTFESSTALQNLVADFNRNSDDYQIKIKQYYDRTTDNTIGNTGYQDAITQFNLDIMAGNCPDILNLSYDSITTYATKGVFEDLTPYLEASGLEIMESLVEAYTFNGALAAIPITTQLRTFVGKSEDVEKLTGWTLDEMMEYVEGHPNETVFAAGPSTMLEYCLKLNQSKFIDWENYTCSFESKEFYDILEFCSRFNGADEIVNTYPRVNILTYDALLYEVTLVSPADYVLIQQLLNTEDITFVGFPTDSGSGTILEENSAKTSLNGSYAIFSKSENKNAAWEFIEALLTTVPEYNDSTIMYGYPVINETRTAFFEEAMTEPYLYEGETAKVRRSVSREIVRGVKTYNYVPLKEELAPIIELLENAEVALNNDQTIMDIILENAADYFSGQHTAKDVAKQIQSTVNLYINERR